MVNNYRDMKKIIILLGSIVFSFSLYAQRDTIIDKGTSIWFQKKPYDVKIIKKSDISSIQIISVNEVKLITNREKSFERNDFVYAGIEPLILDYRIWNGGFGSIQLFTEYLDELVNDNISKAYIYNLQGAETFNIIPSDKVEAISFIVQDEGSDSLTFRLNTETFHGKEVNGAKFGTDQSFWYTTRSGIIDSAFFTGSTGCKVLITYVKKD